MDEAERCAREAIAKTLAIATQAGDARRADDYAACFTAAGVLQLGDRRIEGRDALRDFMRPPPPAATAAPPAPRPAGAPGFVSHHLTTCRIDLDGCDAARVRTYWLVMTAIGPDHSGYYADRFERVGADWLIAHRAPRTLWASPDSRMARAAGG